MRRNSSIFPPSAVSDPTEMTFLMQRLSPGDKVTFFYRVNETSPVKSMTVEVEGAAKFAGNLNVYLKKKGPMRPGQTGGPALEAGYGGVKYAASLGAKRIPVLALSKGSASMLEDKAPTMRGALANPRRAHAGEHRIYVANLAAYNSGRLRGKWIEPSTDADELREQVLEAIGGNPDHEWAFHDYDAFPNMGENPDLDDVAAMAEILEEHPYAVVKAATDFVGDDVDALKEWLDGGYGIYESEKDYVEQFVDEMGGPSALGKDAINSYFDYDSLGHDISIDADEEDREQYEGMSDEEIGMQYIDDAYGDKIPADLADRYFDYDAYARDVFMEVASVRIPGEGIVVFNAR